ncbi:polysaccharide deacetylase family protein [Candidatus Neptunochlamydia vexilliferae]|uniref:polysaccharide deacetylase family protein n=1 Tax=Candidatus Neptunichlamydia vexilliferae TaxID=1651774 RepID=UPI001891B960|nr:polysaccharide deacetylase family protein [Candidatus Neptunochlamydia vexilliferae]
MLLALLYHKIGNGKYANSLEKLEEHFAFIASHYPTVHPGEKLASTSVCLTFDDAFFDFYHLIFPLLQKYHLKALLAVPTAYIPENTPLSPEERLDKVATFPDKAPPIPSPAFCTWEELKKLAASPLIQIASHSLHHRPLNSSHVDAEKELLDSKKVLESKLHCPITSFVYPFGIFDKKVHSLARQHYSHIFRIGNASNFSWNQNLIYRINADQLPAANFPFRPQHQLKHTPRYFLNRLRSK